MTSILKSRILVFNFFCCIYTCVHYKIYANCMGVVTKKQGVVPDMAEEAALLCWSRIEVRKRDPKFWMRLHLMA